ncbi:uncharacterized protein DNG_08798 [Cephalotrichum gorgonifer]|uniref:Uncharacterized protein n=1 Tax=Cephalotrichum gorgonifer TaxID=2041049 RepID=A0AAE8N656_9PEZI|nr:uncharacterized protein DNG_08798 [Cephalotrichum gorgonifer]
MEPNRDPASVNSASDDLCQSHPTTPTSMDTTSQVKGSTSLIRSTPPAIKNDVSLVEGPAPVPRDRDPQWMSFLYLANSWTWVNDAVTTTNRIKVTATQHLLCPAPTSDDHFPCNKGSIQEGTLLPLTANPSLTLSLDVEAIEMESQPTMAGSNTPILMDLIWDPEEMRLGVGYGLNSGLNPTPEVVALFGQGHEGQMEGGFEETFQSWLETSDDWSKGGDGDHTPNRSGGFKY